MTSGAAAALRESDDVLTRSFVLSSLTNKANGAPCGLVVISAIVPLWTGLEMRRNPLQTRNFSASDVAGDGKILLQAFVRAEYSLHEESNSSGRGESIKIKVEIINNH